MAREQNKTTDWRDEIGKAVDEQQERDESGRFKAKEEVDAKEPDETSETEEQGETLTPLETEKEESEEVEEVEGKVVEKIDPPAHFTAEEKQFFTTLDPEQQKWIASSVKRMSSTVDKRMQELSGYQRRAQAFDEMLSPYREQFALRGVDEIAAVRQLIATYAQLQRDPATTIKWLAQQYGVNVADEDVEQDPQTQQLQNYINQLQNGFQQLQGTIQTDRYNHMLNAVSQFADEKDAQGNIKRPHFEAVVDDMMALIKGGIVPPNDLQTAYDRACAFHPELTTVHHSTQTIESKDSKSKPNTEAAEKAARAKKAAAGVKSGAGSPKTEAPKTRRQEIESLVSEHLK